MLGFFVLFFCLKLPMVNCLCKTYKGKQICILKQISCGTTNELTHTKSHLPKLRHFSLQLNCNDSHIHKVIFPIYISSNGLAV